jgi:pectinesterase
MLLKITAAIFFFILISIDVCAFNNIVVVSQDGSGDFKSIQTALNSLTSELKDGVLIYIKNGTYNEKIFIENSNVALVGEDRNQTKIVYSELRKNWKENHADDYGSSVVNIKNNVTDILLSNLTIYNNYGSIYDDHAFAIRAGEGVTRIILDNCNVISDGGDTISLWNTDEGMYYHSNCYFEGWVDYVCPRGFCYIENSKFFGHNLTASIWHDGSHNQNQKFVLRNCKFDGVEGFPLGRYHRDAQFFLIQCSFSKNMADQKIFFAPSNPPRVLQWGENRQYYYNCHGDSVDYPWFEDNLQMAPDNPNPEIINASWTFNQRWDPQQELLDFYKSLAAMKP